MNKIIFQQTSLLRKKISMHYFYPDTIFKYKASYFINISKSSFEHFRDLLSIRTSRKR